MLNLKTIAGALLVAVLTLGAAAPSKAAFVYNPETSTWGVETASSPTRKVRGSSIKREIVAYQT